MNIEKLENAQKLKKQIDLMKKNINTLELAVSDTFKQREMALNILGNSQEHGDCFIPENISKDVCKIILNQSKILLFQYESDFNKL